MQKISAFIKRVPPGLMLVLLAPVLGELVSAHQTPLEFINPMNFFILSLPYGLGAVLARELIVRRKKGLLALLLLGIAYGIYEEGVVVHSFFNLDWNELGSLARYGYYGGINWTWSELMVHFHTFISIGSSILLAEIIYPERRNESWLNNKWLIVCFIGLAAWAPAGLFMTDYFPSAGWYILSWVAVLALIAGAWFLPALPPSPVKKKSPRPVFFFLLGMVNTVVFFLTVYLTPDSGIPLAVTALFLIVFDAITLWLIYRWSGRGYQWNDTHRLALITGFLAFFIYFCFDKDIESFSGLSIIGIITVVCLWLIWRAVKRRPAG